MVTPDLIISVADWQGPETMIPMLEINQLEEIYQSGRNLGTTKVLGKDDIYYIIFTSERPASLKEFRLVMEIY